MTDKIDEFISAKLQACAINFDYYITTLFGEKYSLGKELALAIQFSPLTPGQRDAMRDNPHITTNVSFNSTIKLQFGNFEAKKMSAQHLL